jgi:cytosine/adenosine deaminase-related metal-dependent hydrolase
MTAQVALTVTNALLLTVADGQDPFVGWMAIGADGRIAGIGAGRTEHPAGRVLDVQGAIVAPGFVSAHSHLFTSGMRGLAPSDTLYRWLKANTALVLGHDAEDMYWSTLHGCLGFINNGVTSAYNFPHTRFVADYDPADGSGPVHVRGRDFLRRQFDAAADSGIRILTSLRVEHEALGPHGAAEEFAEMADAVRTATPAGQHLGVSVYGSVQWSGSPIIAELEAEMMDRYGITNQAHFVETAEGLEGQRAKFAWYQNAGALNPRMLFGHFVHPTDDMVAAVAAGGCRVVWQPSSNGRLGSGVTDVPRLRQEGIPIGIGLDDQSCCDASDPFENMRAGLFLIRATRSDASVLQPREILRMHTLGAAEVLSVADRVGSLEAGKYADFLIVDQRRPDTGPVWDAWASYVLACGLRNLRQVWIGGRLVSSDGVSSHPLAEVSGNELHRRMGRIALAANVRPPVGTRAEPERAFPGLPW